VEGFRVRVFGLILFFVAGGSSGADEMVVSGAVVKGPLARATVDIYSIDYTKPDFKGQLVVSGVSDESARFSSLAIKNPAPPYLVEARAFPGLTVDLTSGQLPPITRMRTLILSQDDADEVYVTPISSVISDLALAHADLNADGMTTISELNRVAARSSELFKEIFMLGISEQEDLLEVSPLLERPDDYEEVVKFRTAVEALSAVVVYLADFSGIDVDTVFDEVVMDISDGRLDAMVSGEKSGSYGESALDALPVDVSELLIPGTQIAVGSTWRVMAEESGLSLSQLADRRQSIPLRINRGDQSNFLDQRNDADEYEHSAWDEEDDHDDDADEYEHSAWDDEDDHDDDADEYEHSAWDEEDDHDDDADEYEYNASGDEKGRYEDADESERGPSDEETEDGIDHPGSVFEEFWNLRQFWNIGW